MILRLSQKLSTKIKAGTLKAMLRDENPYADWTCHLFTADRTQYIILSNTKSLYSCVMYGKGITDDNRFIERAISSIRDFMEDDGQAFVYQRFIAPAGGTISFAKALNRSVTGSMNDLIKFAKLWLANGEISPHDIGFMLNDILLSSLASEKSREHGKPNEAFKLMAGSCVSDEREVAGIKLCWCPSGTFTMGSPPDEPERRPGEGQVEVTLTKGFWMAKYEVTQGQWRRVMGKLPGELTAQLPEGDDFPVGNVNFAETEAFCQKLTALGHDSGDLPMDWVFRLPTEAQWEYACRARTTTATSFGQQLSSKQANFKGKPYNGAEPGPSLNRAAKVGSYPANAWGLHDMHGNIFEWCRDWYHARLPSGTDPDLYSAQSSATKSEHGDVSRVRRGGCWADEGWPCRSAFRLRFEPERRYDHIGFRVVVVQQ